MPNKEAAQILIEKKLKVTPQRLAVLDVVHTLDNHPTADQIIEVIRFSQPNVSLSTVYKILDTFTRKGILTKVKTDNETMRYEPALEHHHHLYCAESERIEDFNDPGLDALIHNYLASVKVPDFEIQDVRLQIVGRFTDKKPGRR
jgi:Fur family peroxide stress response transcriptional regulator